MATAPSKPTIAPETQERIHSPLHRLRGTIRRYIVWESLAWVFILLGAWFWIGLLIDYGGFKVTGFDLVQVLPKWFRAAVLLAVAGFVGTVLLLKVLRLARQFRPDALALVLERRFPKLLGDKLITAVELSDLDQAEKYGYSRQMIAETVRDVSTRVDRIPIREAFNWGLLRKRWLLAAAITLGMMLLVTAVYLGRYRTGKVGDFAYRFADVSGVWFERNILLEDTLWPRRAHLEFVEFPSSGEMRIGRDAPSPRLRTIAVKWVLADRKSEGFWRPMLWSDLNPKLLAEQPVPQLPSDAIIKLAVKHNLLAYLRDDDLNAMAASLEGKDRGDFLLGVGANRGFLSIVKLERALGPGNFANVFTIDQLEQILTEEKLRKELSSQVGGEQLPALDHVLEELDKRAGEAKYSRKLRKLEIPQNVSVHYWGAKTSSEMPMARQQDSNEFAGVLNELKESVKLYVKGEDFTTYPYKKITLVPPPMLTKLEKDEYLPAYQYHRLPADGGPQDLKGKKQERLGQGVSLTGGTSRIEIAYGSDLILRGELDKDLDQALIRYRTNQKPGNGPAAENGAAKVEPLPLGDDRRTISKRFDNVTRQIEFDFEFTDTDNVRSLRHMIIQPIDDKTPDVNVAVEIIRKTNQGYMCTPQAMIPFSGSVRDDVGLEKVEYLLSFSKVESMQVLGIRAAVAAGVLGTASPSPALREVFTAPGLAEYLGRLCESQQAVTTMDPILLKSFQELLDEKNRDHRYGKAKLAELLHAANGSVDPAHGAFSLDDMRKQRQISAFEIKPNLEWLDLQDRVAAFQKGLDDTIRPRYKMRLTIQATDNNIETGPRTGQNKETFTFIVVPYEELLAEMNKDEETLAAKAQELYDKMQDVRTGINNVVDRMPRVDGSQEFGASASRMFEYLGEVEKGSDVARELLSEYNRLLKESQTNRVPSKFIEDKQRVCDRLDEAIRIQFERAREAHTVFRDALEARRVPDPAVIEASRQRHEELLRQLDSVLNAIGPIISVTRLSQDLIRLINGTLVVQQMIGELLKNVQYDVEVALATLSPKGDPIALRKGDRQVVSFNIGRDANARGPLLVRFAVPADSGLNFPKDLLVPAGQEKAQFEIGATDKAGSFAVGVTVFDSTGKNAVQLVKPFSLSVTVK